MPKAVVAITGASGARYGVRLVEQLSDSGWDVDLIVTGAGAINLDLECGMEPDALSELNGVTLHHNANLAARPASGSAKYDACVVCPASGTTIGKIAAGIAPTKRPQQKADARYAAKRNRTTTHKDRQ